MVKIPKLKKNQKYLILIIAIVVVAFIVIWLLFLKEGAFISPAEEFLPEEGIRINFGILDDPVLEQLHSFEEISPFEDGERRNNPFIPY